MNRPARLGAALALVIIVGLVTHLELARRLSDFLDPDEAVVALMARHIGAGRQWPVFYYGQPYLGALEAYGVAATFTIGDATPPAARLFAVLVWLSLVAATLALGRAVGGLEVGAVAAMLVTLVPPDVLAWHLRIRGGFTLAAALLAAALALALAERPRSSVVTASFGLVAGLAVWVNQLTAPALAVAALVTLVGRRERLLAAGAFIVGAAPMWWYNIVHPLATPRYFVAQLAHGVGEAGDNLRLLLSDSLPRLFAGPGLAARTGVEALAGTGFALVVVGIVALSVYRAPFIVRAYRTGASLRAGDVVLLALLVSLPARRNHQLNQLLHWTPVVAVLLAWLPQVSSRRWWRVVPATMLLIAALETALWLPTFAESARAVHELVRVLDDLGVDGVYAEHRPTYLIAFFSDERIAATPTLSYGYEVDRYPRYAERVAGARRRARVFEAGSGNERSARERGDVVGEPITVAGYHVYVEPR